LFGGAMTPIIRGPVFGIDIQGLANNIRIGVAMAHFELIDSANSYTRFL
jgi:hypothetical protein